MWEKEKCIKLSFIDGSFDIDIYILKAPSIIFVLCCTALRFSAAYHYRAHKIQNIFMTM